VNERGVEVAESPMSAAGVDERATNYVRKERTEEKNYHRQAVPLIAKKEEYYLAVIDALIGRKEGGSRNLKKLLGSQEPSPIMETHSR